MDESALHPPIILEKKKMVAVQKILGNDFFFQVHMVVENNNTPAITKIIIDSPIKDLYSAQVRHTFVYKVSNYVKNM